MRPGVIHLDGDLLRLAHLLQTRWHDLRPYLLLEELRGDVDVSLDRDTRGAVIRFALRHVRDRAPPDADAPVELARSAWATDGGQEHDLRDVRLGRDRGATRASFLRPFGVNLSLPLPDECVEPLLVDVHVGVSVVVDRLLRPRLALGALFGAEVRGRVHAKRFRLSIIFPLENPEPTLLEQPVLPFLTRDENQYPRGKEI